MNGRRNHALLAAVVEVVTGGSEMIHYPAVGHEALHRSRGRPGCHTATVHFGELVFRVTLGVNQTRVDQQGVAFQDLGVSRDWHVRTHGFDHATTDNYVHAANATTVSLYDGNVVQGVRRWRWRFDELRHCRAWGRGQAQQYRAEHPRQ